VQNFSHISEKNVGSQPNFSRIFSYRDNSAKPNISRNLFPASRNLKKNSAWRSTTPSSVIDGLVYVIKKPESHRDSRRKDMSLLTQGLNYHSACDIKV